MAIITAQEFDKQISAYKQALLSLAVSQSYKMGSRQYVRADLSEIRDPGDAAVPGSGTKQSDRWGRLQVCFWEGVLAMILLLYGPDNRFHIVNSNAAYCIRRTAAGGLCRNSFQLDHYEDELGH